MKIADRDKNFLFNNINYYGKRVSSVGLCFPFNPKPLEDHIIKLLRWPGDKQVFLIFF